ncbi:MAG TPA: PAS domain S-box protein, partial [Polyangiaceae bacterium]|nr:PAS domain S-box protein [Polyangiaceae bacterium]
MDDTDTSAALRRELVETKRALADAHADLDLVRAELETEKEQAARSRVLSDAGFEAVCLHIDGRFVDLNRAAVELLGAPAEQILGKPILSLAPPEYHAEIVERVRSGQTSWYEVVAVRPDGTRFPAELRGRTVEIDGRTVRATAVRDLSEKKRAEDALRRSEIRFRGVFEGAIDGIVLIDRSNHIVDANPAACRLLRRDSLSGILVSDLVVRGTEESRERKDSVPAPPSSAGPVIERRLRRGDGTTVEVEVAAGRISEETTEWVLRDLTRRRQLEAEQHVLRAELARAQRLEALGRLAGGVAHDFNNLLTVIGLGLEALAKNRANALEAALLVEVRGATERAVDLTRRLLALGRRQVLRPRRVDLSTTVDEMAWLLLRMVGDRIEVKLDLAPGAGAVEVDPDQLFQVLMNLSINARDAMPEGGLLTIATRTAPTPGHVSIVVTDTGVGMDAETVSRAFEPFFTTKPDAVGSGLGLAIVHGIVVQSHGEISIESEPGLGTR